jgi:branched-chain amino acid transport system ATP-binding protein
VKRPAMAVPVVANAASTEVRDRVCFDSVSVRFGGVTALEGVSFELQSSQWLGVVGPNGAGKTTLLNVISGLVSPTEGIVTVLGRRVGEAASVARRGVSRSFQLIDQFAHVSVREYMMMALDLERRRASDDGLGWLQSKKRSELIDEQLALFGIPARDRATRLGVLSYGVRKRVDLARAFLGRPQVVLLDEPTSGLNDQEVADVVTCLNELDQRNTGSAVLLVDHRVSFVRSVCPQLLVLDFGKVIAEGETEVVLSDQEVIRIFIG